MSSAKSPGVEIPLQDLAQVTKEEVVGEAGLNLAQVVQPAKDGCRPSHKDLSEI